MPKFLTLSKQIVLLLAVFVLLSLLELSQATPMVNARNEDMSESAGEKVHHQRRTYELKKLRHFLLTSNAQQRAAKREKENSLKREFILEYLQAANDPDPSKFEEMRKRIKTYCNSVEDLIHSDRAACG